MIGLLPAASAAGPERFRRFAAVMFLFGCGRRKRAAPGLAEHLPRDPRANGPETEFRVYRPSLTSREIPILGHCTRLPPTG